MRYGHILILVGIAAIPASLGLLLSLLLRHDWLANFIYTGRYYVDLAWIVSTGGIGLSVLGGISALVFMGISQRIERAQAQLLADALEDRRRFLRRLDHEVKNPLTIILLSLSNLQHSPHLSSDESSSLERAAQQVQRLQKLVIDLRWLTELDAKTTERSRIDLREIIRDAVQSAGLGKARPCIHVRYQEVPWPVGIVLGDRDLLVTALRNLLDNAMKFTEETGQVELRASDDGHTVTLEVADTGIGIPADEMPHVFDELYRGQNAKRISGSGMGLALVHRIVTLHHGTITVRSREGHGTVMTINLPLAPGG
ncbi:MAG: HAMP domain-containing histidine kinase [Anaerolineae bacterium]|nr:HAMP domain-containing histidine kinase [Anaerolineae bacterium]